VGVAVEVVPLGGAGVGEIGATACKPAIGNAGPAAPTGIGTREAAPPTPTAAARSRSEPAAPETLARQIRHTVRASWGGSGWTPGPAIQRGRAGTVTVAARSTRPPSLESTGAPRSAIQGVSPTRHRRRSTVSATHLDDEEEEEEEDK
jgi:hypothetical protein